MFAWWESLESVGRIHDVVQVVAVIAVVLSAIAAPATFLLDKRYDTLRQKRDAEHEADQQAEIERLRDAREPRKLSVEQAERLATTLRGGPPGPIKVWYVQGSSEASSFALALDAAVKSAGWETLEPDWFLGTSPPGVHVTRPSAGNVPTHFGLVCQAFVAAKLDPLCGVASKMGEGNLVSVIVGEKP